MEGPAKTAIQFEITEREGVCAVCGGPVGRSQSVECWVT